MCPSASFSYVRLRQEIDGLQAEEALSEKKSHGQQKLIKAELMEEIGLA